MDFSWRPLERSGVSRYWGIVGFALVSGLLIGCIGIGGVLLVPGLTFLYVDQERTGRLHHLVALFATGLLDMIRAGQMLADP